ncbi:MAG TPA: DUF4340 domain-containing protein [Casimicrobiaceae bacterium]|nr:DUF4340 domain-containing protein [Casimicrobiaceae bacterium]
MKRTISLLGALLVAQLLLAFGLSFTGTHLSARAADKPLLSLGGTQIDHITIEGPDKAKVVLAKVASAWQLPEEGGFPADKTRTESLLETLEGLKEGLPVATTSDALARFKVADDRFERRVTLAGGGKTLATLYFGTSPSMREIHARRSGQGDVYSVAFATYEVPVKAGEWEDKTVLQIPKNDIEAIDVAGLHITRAPPPPPPAPAATKTAAANATSASSATTTATATAAAPAAADAARPEWQASGLAKGQELNTEAADKLADLLAELRIGSVLGKDASPEYGIDKPVLDVTLVEHGGRKIEYVLGKAKDGKSYTLKTSTRDEYFGMPTYTAEPLLDAAKRDKLLAVPKAAHEPSAKLGKPEAKG